MVFQLHSCVSLVCPLYMFFFKVWNLLEEQEQYTIFSIDNHVQLDSGTTYISKLVLVSIAFHILCMQAVKGQTRLHSCAVSSEPWLLALP